MNCRVQGTFDSGTPGPFLFDCRQGYNLAARYLKTVPRHSSPQHSSPQIVAPSDWETFASHPLRADATSLILETALVTQPSATQPLPYDSNRSQLRRQLRARRRALSLTQQRQAALTVANQITTSRSYRHARHIALYLANDGEIDLSLLARRAVAQGKDCYLPVLDKRLPVMHFARWRPGDPLLRNRYGIPEPLPRAARIAPEHLDLVCVPLVGFDEQGNRLGMGGGFYDRTFAFRRGRRRSPPLLIGTAHPCQQVEALPLAAWDVPLDQIVTG